MLMSNALLGFARSSGLGPMVPPESYHPQLRRELVQVEKTPIYPSMGLTIDDSDVLGGQISSVLTGHEIVLPR